MNANRCRYCGYKFETAEDLDRHLNEGRGCPEMDRESFDLAERAIFTRPEDVPEWTLE